MYEFEDALRDEGVLIVAGVDEVGRGPLAGPVVAGAVILNPADVIAGIDDSKKLTAKARERLAVQIRNRALAWSVAYVWQDEIDAINIYRASRKAMMLALEGLSIRPQHVLSDAMPLPDSAVPFTAIIHGDARSASIGAASIIAKVERDAFMADMDKIHPGYGFRNNKGYPTAAHLSALSALGASPIHRRTYAPVRAVLERQTTLDLETEARP